MSSCDKLYSENQMRVISKKYTTCKCGNEKGIRQVHCTIYDHKGEKETKLISEEIICENCKCEK